MWCDICRVVELNWRKWVVSNSLLLELHPLNRMNEKELYILNRNSFSFSFWSCCTIPQSKEIEVKCTCEYPCVYNSCRLGLLIRVKLLFESRLIQGWINKQLGSLRLMIIKSQIVKLIFINCLETNIDWFIKGHERVRALQRATAFGPTQSVWVETDAIHGPTRDRDRNRKSCLARPKSDANFGRI